MENLMIYVLYALAGLGALVILATVIVQLTPTPKDDEIVAKVGSFWLSLTTFLPTLGANPVTKKLIEAYRELKNPASKQ